MSTDVTLFHFQDGVPSIEDLAHPNGSSWWEEQDVMNALHYDNVDTFRKVVMRAQQACLSIGIQTEENFRRQDDGRYRFTRFAFYLIAMNGSPRNPYVAAAQVYFAALAQTYQTHLEHADGLDRVMIRDEVTEGEKTLSGVANKHGVECYPLFQNAGYRGMYNMNLTRLKEVKRIPPKAKIIDYMGKQELAAHLFRITQTTAKIQNEGIHGQGRLEQAAEQVGRKVRNSMKEISGTAPEHLPAAEPINKVRSTLKGTNKKLKDI